MCSPNVFSLRSTKEIDFSVDFSVRFEGKTINSTTINSTESPRLPSLIRKRPVFGPDVFYGAGTPTKLPKLSDSGHEQSNGDFVNCPKLDAVPKNRAESHTSASNNFIDSQPSVGYSLGDKTDIKAKETKPKDNLLENPTQKYNTTKNKNSGLVDEISKELDGVKQMFERKDGQNSSAAQGKVSTGHVQFTKPFD